MSSIGFRRAVELAEFLTHLLKERKARAVQIHYRHLHFLTHSEHRLDIGREARGQFSLHIDPTCNRRDQHRFSARCSHLPDECGQIRAVTRHRISLPLGSFSGLVIVTELDQHPVTAFFEHTIP